MVEKNANYGKLFIALLTIAAVVLFVFAIGHSWLSWIAVEDFVNGRIKRIDKIVIFKGFKERTFSDKIAMEYLVRSFKTLKKSKCSKGNIGGIFIYCPYRPIIYGDIFIYGNKPSNACIWIEGDDGSRFDFELPEPIPDEIKSMIEFINKKN